MRKLGLRAYILLNIIVICAIGMFFIGVISTKITEQFAIQGRIEGTKSIIRAFESSYLKIGRIEEGIKFLESALNQGASGYVEIGEKKYNFLHENLKLPHDINLYKNSGKSNISIEGYTFWPFGTYKSYQITYPLRLNNSQVSGVVYIYQPLNFFEDTIKLSQKLTAMWTFLFVVIITIFGYFLLSRTVVNPIQKLIRLTKEIALGKIDSNDSIETNISEIEKLNSSLFSMYKEIENKKNLLEKNIKKLEEANNDLVAAQKQLIASEKLASLGKLSAGVAHEIGNPVSAISGYTELLKTKRNEEKREEYLDKISDEIERINSIIKTLIDYAKPKEQNVQVSNLNDVIKKAVNIVESQGTLKRIDMNLQLSDEFLNVKIDKNQMVQVFINLVLNAVDALNGEGRIEISSSIENENSATVKIKDNGSGIADSEIDKIFDPFYTTKGPRKGTGLGLSICQRIVHEYNGTITAESEVGKGTVFEIIFTCVQN